MAFITAEEVAQENLEMILDTEFVGNPKYLRIIKEGIRAHEKERESIYLERAVDISNLPSVSSFSCGRCRIHIGQHHIVIAYGMQRVIMPVRLDELRNMIEHPGMHRTEYFILKRTQVTAVLGQNGTVSFHTKCPRDNALPHTFTVAYEAFLKALEAAMRKFG